LRLNISKACSINVSHTTVPHDAVPARLVLSKVLDYEDPVTVVKFREFTNITFVVLPSPIYSQKNYTIFKRNISRNLY